jgi:hypothetical protein
MRQAVTLTEPYRKFEAGGLGLTAGDFSQLSKVDLIHPTLGLLTVMRSCVDVPCANCVPILFLPVRLFNCP